MTDWIPVSTVPKCKYVLVTGIDSGGRKWRDVAVHLGGGEFVDKYGADTAPTHWIQLPECPGVNAVKCHLCGLPAACVGHYGSHTIDWPACNACCPHDVCRPIEYPGDQS